MLTNVGSAAAKIGGSGSSDFSWSKADGPMQLAYYRRLPQNNNNAATMAQLYSQKYSRPAIRCRGSSETMGTILEYQHRGLHHIHLRSEVHLAVSPLARQMHFRLTGAQLHLLVQSAKGVGYHIHGKHGAYRRCAYNCVKQWETRFPTKPREQE